LLASVQAALQASSQKKAKPKGPLLFGSDSSASSSSSLFKESEEDQKSSGGLFG
jgi:hypothetical protein